MIKNNDVFCNYMYGIYIIKHMLVHKNNQKVHPFLNFLIVFQNLYILIYYYFKINMALFQFHLIIALKIFPYQYYLS